MYVERTKVMKFLRQPALLHIMTDQKQLVDVEYYNDFVTLVTSNARCTREIKSRISMAKEAFNERNIIFASKLD
jgi:hypothetical protein